MSHSPLYKFDHSHSNPSDLHSGARERIADMTRFRHFYHPSHQRWAEAYPPGKSMAFNPTDISTNKYIQNTLTSYCHWISHIMHLLIDSKYSSKSIQTAVARSTWKSTIHFLARNVVPSQSVYVEPSTEMTQTPLNFTNASQESGVPVPTIDR